MIRSRFFYAACALSAAAIAGCAAPTSTPSTFSFNRPTSVDFVCLRVPVGSDGRIANDTLSMGTEVEAFPLSACPTVNAASNSDVQMVGSTFVGLRLFALVTQADRGEVAVVNLHPRFNTGNVDTQPRVPGFTFIPSGAFASALVVHPAGRATYVANSGERTITVLDNRRLLAGRQFALAAADGSSLAITDLPSEPIDLALRTSGDPAVTALYVLLQDGTVRVYNVTDPLVAPVLQSEIRLRNPFATTTDGGVSEAGADAGDASDASADADDAADANDASDASDAAVEASADADDASDASADDAGAVDAGDASDASDAGADVFDMDAADATSAVDASDASDAADASDGATMDGATALEYRVLPTRLVVGDDGRVYVSDRGLPIVHVLAPGADAFALSETTPLQVGTGTLQVAVSPRLPSDGTHWVYAITVTDRQLVALDATLTAGVPAPSYGTAARANAIADHPGCTAMPFDERACPKIDPNLPHDRVPVRAPARSLGFISIASRDSAGLASCDVSQPLVENCASLPTPRIDVFRGVQAVVALTNGQIQLVDLEDPDRNCDVRVGSSVRRAFLRHIPRGGDSTSKPSVIGAPQLTINGGAASLGGPNPRLSMIDGSASTCDSSNNHCIVLPTQPQDPATVDPIRVRDATYTVRYEGQLPLRTINAASFVSSSTEGSMRMLAPGARFCQLGALAGDRVVLAGPSPYTDSNLIADASVPIAPSDPTCAPDECRRVFGDVNTRCNREFGVRTARSGELELDIPRSNVAGQDRAGEPCGVVSPPAGGPATFAASAAEFTRLLACCYPQATRVEVRANQRWVLSVQPAGRSLEYPNDVVEREGVCVQDPTLGPSSRIRENETYDSGSLRLRIQSGSQPTLRDTAITFVTGGGYAQLVSNTGAAGAAIIRHVCNSDRVYVVDQTPAALREYTIAPFAQSRTFN